MSKPVAQRHDPFSYLLLTFPTALLFLFWFPTWNMTKFKLLPLCNRYGLCLTIPSIDLSRESPNWVCMASGHHLYDMICTINIAHVTSLISCLVSISYCLLEGKSGTTIGSDFNSSFCLDPVREPLISSQCSELCYGWMLSWRQRKHKFTLRGSYLRHRQYKVLSAVYLTQRYKLWQLAIRVPVLDLVKLQNSATMGNP